MSLNYLVNLTKQNAIRIKSFPKCPSWFIDRKTALMEKIHKSCFDYFFLLNMYKIRFQKLSFLVFGISFGAFE